MGILAEVPDEHRVAFVRPWQGRTLVETTEVRQQAVDSAICSHDERNYLLQFYNRLFGSVATLDDIPGTFSGLRPLIRSAADPARARRDSVMETAGAITSVFGGKWTTARALGERFARRVVAGGA